MHVGKKLAHYYHKPIWWVMRKVKYPVLRLAYAVLLIILAYLAWPLVGLKEFLLETTPQFFREMWWSSKDLLKDAWQGDWS